MTSKTGEQILAINILPKRQPDNENWSVSRIQNEEYIFFETPHTK